MYNRTMACFSFRMIPPSAIDTPSGKRAITEPLVDAIIVPTIRTAEHLRSAVQFAADTRCHLILVYTDSPPAGLSAVLDGLAAKPCYAIDRPLRNPDRLLDLGASLPQSLCVACRARHQQEAQPWSADQPRLRVDADALS